MADASARPSSTCPWCGTSVASPSEACPDCGQLPDWRAWVDNCHAQAEQLAPPGWEGLATDEPLNNLANVTGYLRREVAALRILGEKGRGEFWLETANELYANIFRALSALRIWDRPEQLPKAADCDEAERRLDELWRWLAAKEGNSADGIGATVNQLRERLLNPDISDAIADAANAVYRPDEASVGTKIKRPGRKKADYETVQSEAELAADWKQAKEAGEYKPDFAKQKGMTPKDLDALLTRVRKRNSRAD